MSRGGNLELAMWAPAVDSSRVESTPSPIHHEKDHFKQSPCKLTADLTPCSVKCKESHGRCLQLLGEDEHFYRHPWITDSLCKLLGLPDWESSYFFCKMALIHKYTISNESAVEFPNELGLIDWESSYFFCKMTLLSKYVPFKTKGCYIVNVLPQFFKLI